MVQGEDVNRMVQPDLSWKITSDHCVGDELEGMKSREDGSRL